MNRLDEQWWDGAWLYFCVLLCSVPVAVPVLFLLKFGEVNGCLAITVPLAALYALGVGPILFSRGFRFLDGPRPEAQPGSSDDKRQSEDAVYEMACPQCGAKVNPVTRQGLHSPELEPWLLICDNCQATIQPYV